MNNLPARIATIAVFAFGLSGCLGGASSKPSNYYLLTARAAPIENPQVAPRVIGVGPVRVAPFLARPQIVTHAGSGNLQFADDRRWSEPLEQGVQRVLLQNLAALTQADMRNFPWTQITAPDYAVRVEVLDLDHSADGQAIMDVQWVLEDLKQGKLLTSRREHFSATLPSGAVDYTALTGAYSDLLAQLAQHVANVLPVQQRE